MLLVIKSDPLYKNILQVKFKYVFPLQKYFNMVGYSYNIWFYQRNFLKSMECAFQALFEKNLQPLNFDSTVQ